MDEISITADIVSESMMRLVEEGRYESGTVFEISKQGERVIPAWNIDPPGTVNGRMAEGTTIPQQAIDKANAPLLDITKKELGALLK